MGAGVGTGGAGGGPLNTTLESRRRVLFVDDEPRFLDMIEKVMGAFSAGRWQVYTAENASRALALIQEHTPHLVVIDVQMPVVDGLQFLTLINRRYPNLQKVVLTGFATEAYRAACLSNGAELFLEKPKSRAEQESLFAALDELMRFQPEEGFRGVLRKVGLSEIIQMECLGVGTSVLEVKTGRQQGRIFIQDGRIIHAEAGELAGEPAFNFILGLRGGEFFVRPFVPPPMQTIQGSWEFLLMEAVRQRDEAGAAETETTGSAQPPAPTESLAPEPGTAPVCAPLTLPEPPDGAGVESLAAAPVEAVGPATTAGATEPVRRPGADRIQEASPTRRIIEEVFVCSQAGALLHEWHVRNSDLWVNFFEFLSQKARRIAMGLPLGPFERLDVSDGTTELAILIDDDRGVLVRSRDEPEPGDGSAPGAGVAA